MLPGPDLDGARGFLDQHFGGEASAVELIGEGMWSRAFGFDHDGRALVVRFGRHRDDYEKDRRAAAFASASLPVPDVLEIGPAVDGWFAISERAYGVPLEQIDADGWHAVMPSLLDVYDGLRSIDTRSSSGWGGWDEHGRAPFPSWRAFLLAVDEDTPARRTSGWRSRLAASPFGNGPFHTAMARLRELTDRGAPVERSVVHADLINRNVLVESGRVSAVFDWGCSLYGDSVYELAWMQFWQPWYPAMVAADVAATIARHLAAGDAVGDFDARLTACLLHVGLDHMAYNAWTGDHDELGRVIDRTLGLID